MVKFHVCKILEENVASDIISMITCANATAYFFCISEKKFVKKSLNGEYVKGFCFGLVYVVEKKNTLRNLSITNHT